MGKLSSTVSFLVTYTGRNGCRGRTMFPFGCAAPTEAGMLDCIVFIAYPACHSPPHHRWHIKFRIPSYPVQSLRLPRSHRPFQTEPQGQYGTNGEGLNGRRGGFWLLRWHIVSFGCFDHIPRIPITNPTALRVNYWRIWSMGSSEIANRVDEMEHAEHPAVGT